MKTHDFSTRYWGHNIEYIADLGEGKHRVAGHSTPRPNKGDLLTLEAGTTWKIVEIKYMRDPRDMWFATCEAHEN